MMYKRHPPVQLLAVPRRVNHYGTTKLWNARKVEAPWYLFASAFEEPCLQHVSLADYAGWLERRIYANQVFLRERIPRVMVELL
jgi:hypothetical protein